MAWAIKPMVTLPCNNDYLAQKLNSAVQKLQINQEGPDSNEISIVDFCPKTVNIQGKPEEFQSIESPKKFS